MRDLNITDAFQLSKIIDKMEIRFDIDEMMDQIQDILTNEGTSKAQSYLGGQMVLTLVSKLHKAEKELIEWLASLTGMTVEEIQKLKFKELKSLLLELFNSEDFLELFTSAEATEQQ